MTEEEFERRKAFLIDQAKRRFAQNPSDASTTGEKARRNFVSALPADRQKTNFFSRVLTRVFSSFK